MAVSKGIPIVIKIGGAVLSKLNRFWHQVAALPYPVVVVHGGGAQSTRLAKRLGHTPRIIQGRRVTSDLDLAVAEWAMRGEVNLRLVSEGLSKGVNCVGLSGADGGMIKVKKRKPWTIEGEVIDFGWVGDITRIDPHVIRTLLRGGYVPVIAPLARGPDGHRYNVNADTVAGALAQALKAKELLLVTDTGGLRRQTNKSNSLLRKCLKADYEQGLQEGWITGGMHVKLHVAYEALEGGVESVYILGPDHVKEKRYATRVLADSL